MAPQSTGSGPVDPQAAHLLTGPEIGALQEPAIPYMRGSLIQLTSGCKTSPETFLTPRKFLRGFYSEKNPSLQAATSKQLIISRYM